MTKATSTVSSTAAPPLTTLFTQPTECASLFTRLNSTSTLYRNGRFRTLEYYQSNTADARFSSCNPPGWDRNNFTFSPAVCPSGWIYYGAFLSTDRSHWPYSQAHCCASGYKYDHGGCERSRPTPGPGNRFLDDADETTTTLFLHKPFVVQWRKYETKTLPISLPNLSGANLAEWTPGTPEPTYRSDSDNKELYQGVITLIAVCSIVGFFVMIGLLWCANRAMEGGSGTRPSRQGTELAERRRAAAAAG